MKQMTLRLEITPKNILMMDQPSRQNRNCSPSVACPAPFIKVEATKFTEVGYVGRDVESIIRDLADVSVKMTREVEIQKVRHLAEDLAEEEYWMFASSGKAEEKSSSSI